MKGSDQRSVRGYQAGDEATVGSLVDRVEQVDGEQPGVTAVVGVYTAGRQSDKTVCGVPYVRPVGWRRGGFRFSAWDAPSSNNTPDWSNRPWINAFGDIRLRHSRQLSDVFRHHLGTPCSPQTGSRAGL